MNENPPIKSTIDSYRKRRSRSLPIIIWGLAAVLVIGGIIILVLSLKDGDGSFSLFATKTPTPTITPSPTNTLPPTKTPTVTSTPTLTNTPTPSAPFYYIVLDGDYLSTIAEKFNLGESGVIHLLNPGIDPVTQTIYTGQEILVPPPGWPMPTLTPWPVDAPRGTKITYYVQPGDSLGTIADKFLSTIAEIIKANPDALEDETSLIYPGQMLIVPVNLITPVPTKTGTPAATATPTATATP